MSLNKLDAMSESEYDQYVLQGNSIQKLSTGRGSVAPHRRPSIPDSDSGLDSEVAIHCLAATATAARRMSSHELQNFGRLR